MIHPSFSLCLFPSRAFFVLLLDVYDNVKTIVECTNSSNRMARKKKKNERCVEDTLVKTIYTAKAIQSLCHHFSSFHAASSASFSKRRMCKERKKRNFSLWIAIAGILSDSVVIVVVVV